MDLVVYGLIFCCAAAAWTFLAGDPWRAALARIEVSSKAYEDELRRQSSSEVSPTTLARIEVLGPAVVFLVVYFIGAGVMFAAVGAGVAYFGPQFFIKKNAAKRIDDLELQFPEMLTMVVANLRAGLSFDESLRACQHKLPEPMGSEIRVVCREVDLGARSEDALANAAKRSQVSLFRSFATAMGIVQAQGGNAPLLLEQFAVTTAALRTAEQSIKTETSGARFQGYLMLAMVPVFLFLMWGMDPSITANLFGTLLGNVILAIVAMLCFGAYHMIQVFCNPDI